jgi:hypothetical protein
LRVHTVIIQDLIADIQDRIFRFEEGWQEKKPVYERRVDERLRRDVRLKVGFENCDGEV